MKDILLHNTNFTDIEHMDIGDSGLQRRTENFYVEYGIDKAIKYYSDLKEKIRFESPDTCFENQHFIDCIHMLTKLLILKENNHV